MKKIVEGDLTEMWLYLNIWGGKKKALPEAGEKKGEITSFQLGREGEGGFKQKKKKLSHHTGLFSTTSSGKRGGNASWFGVGPDFLSSNTAFFGTKGGKRGRGSFLLLREKKGRGDVENDLLSMSGLRGPGGKRGSKQGRDRGGPSLFSVRVAVGKGGGESSLLVRMH